MLLARDLYRVRYDFPRSNRQPSTTLMIASVPRSGSTYFGICLWNEGIFGAPLEYLNENTNAEIRHRLSSGDMNGQYWQELQAVRTASNGLFSYKMFIANYITFKNNYPELLPLIAPDKVVYLTRDDKVSQAISYARAIQTKRWFAAVENRSEPEYSFDAIRRQERSILQQEEVWERIFALTDTEPYRISYERFLRESERVFAEIADYVGVEIASSPRLDIGNIDKQSDDLTRLWRERFLEEKNRVADASMAA